LTQHNIMILFDCV